MCSFREFILSHLIPKHDATILIGNDTIFQMSPHRPIQDIAFDDSPLLFHNVGRISMGDGFDILFNNGSGV
eukprot:scaffold6566_cov125-Amphora_coffeaeformis.AAC.6